MMETTKLCLGVVDRVFKCLSLGMGCLVSSILNLTTSSTDGPSLMLPFYQNLCPDFKTFPTKLVLNFEKDEDLIKS